jgi:hypothetical protein
MPDIFDENSARVSSVTDVRQTLKASRVDATLNLETDTGTSTSPPLQPAQPVSAPSAGSTIGGTLFLEGRGEHCFGRDFEHQ